MKTYIYILQDPLTEEVRYVGKSNNPKRRYQSHLWNKPKVKYYSYYWIQSLLKKGLKPIMTIIDETENNWEDLEKYWIDQFKSWGFKLTNITKGGEGANGAGKWNNTEVSVYDKNGNFIKTFESQKQCAEYFKTSSGNVKAVVTGKNRLLLKQYQIKYGNSSENINPVKNRKVRKDKNQEKFNTRKSIKCIEDGIIFSCIKNASLYYNISLSSLSNILNGRSKKSRSKKTFCYI